MTKAEIQALVLNLCDGRDAALRVLDRAQADGELEPSKIENAKFLIREGFDRAVEAIGRGTAATDE